MYFFDDVTTWRSFIF